MTIEEFIEKCQKRPLPSNPMARIRLLAKELADGMINEVWRSDIQVIDSKKFKDLSPGLWIEGSNNENLLKYIWERWTNIGGGYPSIELLIRVEYLKILKTQSNYVTSVQITQQAVDLLEEADPATIFISYKRSESSAFALLVHDRLKQYGLEPFVDMQLKPGQKWYDVLKSTIQNVDYLILLLGKETLLSSVTIDEIQWATEANKTIITIRHNGFTFENADWAKTPEEIRKVIEDTHSLEVLDENPSEYDATLERLTNYFQISSATNN